MGHNVDAFQKFLDDAVAEKFAPGFQCVVFDRDSIIYNGVSGFATLPSEENPEGKVFKPDTLGWLASCSKLCISLIVLHILEKGLTKDGFSLKDLDNHEALVKYVPEFKLGSGGSLLTKIIEGFEDEPGPDGRKVMKLKDAKTPVTLRMLLTHTAGMHYYIIDAHLKELYLPSDGSAPNFQSPIETGDIGEITIPLVAEPNTTWSYGWSSEWLGLFASRSTGRTVRQLHKDIIFDPLGISPSELDIWIPSSQREALPGTYIRTQNQGFTRIPDLNFYSTENELPEGKTIFHGSVLFSTSQAYAKVLQAVLRGDTKLLSKEAWLMATKDDLKERNIKVPRPLWTTAVPQLMFDVDEYAKSTAAENGTGANLLQCLVATAPTVSGRSAGSFGWAGIGNTYYFVDPVKGVGAILATQLLPFYEPRMIEMRDKLETLVSKWST